MSREANKQAGDSLVGNLAVWIIYSSTGMLIFLLVINLTAIIGILITWMLKDQIGLTSFKILSTITAIGTVIFYLINFGL